MSVNLIFILLIFSQLMIAKEILILKGDYLGQAPPGNTPVVFAHGIVSTPTTIEHGFPSFSPDGDEVFWQANSLDQKIINGMSMRRVGGQWTAPQVSPYDSGPVFSPDGKRLYFLPMGVDKGEKNGPYFVEKTSKGWGKPKCLGLIARFPELKYVYNLSVTRNGTLYFLSHATGLGTRNDWGIYRAEYINGEYAKPVLLPPSINAPSGVVNWTPFIAPDESYLLFSSDRVNTQRDLFVCFRQPDGSWTDAISLGAPINSDREERFPVVSPDGKYLFFTRWVSDDDEDVFWVSADIIEKLKAKAIQEGRLKRPSGKKQGTGPRVPK